MRDQEAFHPAIVEVEKVEARLAVMQPEIGNADHVTIGNKAGVTIERGIGVRDQPLGTGRFQQGSGTGAANQQRAARHGCTRREELSAIHQSLRSIAHIASLTLTRR
jgi:hypothetical protein